MALRILIFLTACTACLSKASGAWRQPKLDSCILHPDLEARIAKDVSIWSDGGISEEVGLSVVSSCDLNKMPPDLKPEQNCNKAQRILVENGTVYLTNIANTVHMSLDERIGFLVELYQTSQEYNLPNVEFTHWFDDIPSGSLAFGPDGKSLWPFPPAGCMPPVMAWSKWKECSVLLVPNSGHFRCVRDGFDELEALLENIATSVPWNERLPVAFGRWSNFCPHFLEKLTTADGKPMKCPRTHYEELSKQHSHLLDMRDRKDGHELPIQHQNRFRYLVSTDGLSVSCKLEKYLLLGSALLKTNSSVFAYFYDALKPYEHYLPVMVKSSDDILEMVPWMRANDERVHAIAQRGQEFALNNLHREARLCYIFRLIKELSKKMGYKPTCKRRELCVPLVHEIKFLAGDKRTSMRCEYQSVLSRFGNSDDAVATGRRAKEYDFKDLGRLHDGGNAWPRDDLLKDKP
ncbi:hypothetical protein Agub_g12078 [Astrephomene gubernaculifera]|uniref:Glycosyl transferase CAP10 domain-containing protein n=1 Tax=Astrephomene gubernaculifera TaxID=47775 RepID=A0AAD3DY60_9CHLO|nr:hypothetical protein Agub_g12078 [Astrephomene gubernaculifera]